MEQIVTTITEFFTVLFAYAEDWWLAIFFAWWGLFWAVSAVRRNTGWLVIPAASTAVVALGSAFTYWQILATRAGENLSCVSDRDDFCITDEGNRMLQGHEVLMQGGDLNHVGTLLNVIAGTIAWWQCLALFVIAILAVVALLGAPFGLFKKTEHSATT